MLAHSGPMMLDRTFITLMRLLPKSALSSAVGYATRAPAPPAVHRLAIRAFARAFSVEADQAEHELGSYRTFSDFFSRRLKEGARPIEPGERLVVSPVDGHVSQAGVAKRGQCIQAKGICFELAGLLGDEQQARAFEGGPYATLYLSPRDYHRIHAPLPGQIEGYSYLPGELWPVNARSVRAREALYSLNERLVTYFQTPAGRLALVAVGATCVARIRAAYDQILTHAGERGRAQHYPQPIEVQKGQEIGAFEMGSTVILFFEPGRVRWDAALTAGTGVRVGQRIGEVP